MNNKENDHQSKSEKQAPFPTPSLGPDFPGIGGEIGPYKLLSVLGEGGFGIVYLAEQKRPIKQQVALKIIKPGMDSKQVIARFEAERQALALLEHPNIAYIFRAGSTQAGRPYFAMEYIKGSPITEYCDHHKLSIQERLKLFVQVCEAVQHAHQKGIIHRDIKPSNILINTQDGKAVPKVIDFGVAKAISMPLTEKTMFTQQGQLIGTPEYMSPEQSDFKDKDIDTRTDIYSLGVVLYELVAGILPFEPETLREGGFAEIQRIIREEEPPRPSTKLSSLGEDATKIAQRRKTQLSSLLKSLHKELEWIPLMAIRKNRDQRYKTASSLAQDVQSYLDGNLLVAGPESKMYRFKKYVQRNRILIATTAVMVLTCAIVFVFELNSRRVQAANNLESITKFFGYNCQIALTFDLPEDAEELLLALSSKPSIVRACIYDTDNNVFAVYPPSEPKDIFEIFKSKSEGTVFTGEYLEAFYRIRLNNEVLGSISLRSDMRDFRRDLKYDLSALGIILFINLLVTNLLITKLKKPVSKSIFSLKETAKHVTVKKE